MENTPRLYPDEDQPISIDMLLLRDVIRRKAGRLLLVGGLVLGAFGAQQLLLSPQTYRGEASIVMQQSSSAASGLGALLGGGGAATKKYIGLLRSRSLAEAVERQANIQGLYRLKTHQEALARLMDNIKPEDSPADGLLMVRLTLPAPPVLAPDPTHQREKVRLAVAQCTNLYAAALRDYYDLSNSDRDNVLLKAAASEQRQARAEYQQATSHILAFIAGLDRVPVRSAPSGMTVESSSGATPDMVFLYQEQDRVDADIRSTEAIQQAQTRLTAGQLQNLKTLPSEDILLNEARNSVHKAEVSLKRLSDVYGPDNPKVRDAEDNLKNANQELDRQKQGIRSLQTTDQVELTKKLEGLQARRKTIAARIATTEGGLSTKRGLTSHLELLRNEQALALKRLEQAEIKAVEVRLSAVSGKSMITVVDEAEPPLQGSPSKIRTLLLGLLLAGLAMGGTAIVEYLRHARRRALDALQFTAAAYTASLQNPPPAPKNGGKSADKSNGANGANGSNGSNGSNGAKH